MRIGITRGIGSGKSYVCKYLAQKGIEVYDCDQAAKRLIRTEPSIREALTALIGADAYTADGCLNKAVVAQTTVRRLMPLSTLLCSAIFSPATSNGWRVPFSLSAVSTD